MPIIKKLHDNKYIGIYEEYNYRIIGKMAVYHSIVTNEEYDMVTDIKILDTENNTVIYESYNIDMAYNKEGIISIVNYADKVLFYLHNETCDIYWKRLFLDKLFRNMNTINIEIYYMNKTRELAEQQRIKEWQDTNKTIDNLKEQIKDKYNQQGIAVFYTACELYLINEPRIIPQQKNMYDYIEKSIEKYPDIFKPHILKHIKLNWDKLDIPILNTLLKEE